jgi:MFS family permease
MAEELAASAPASWRDVFRGPRGRLTVGLLLLEALAAIHVLVVATIMPKVLADLGMLQLYGLAFTMSSLATIGAIPIAGHALDRYGARRLLTLVLGLFALGLLVDATAISMPILLVGQFLVGAGIGGLYAISLGTVAKSYPDDLRARVLALLSTAVGVAAALDPDIPLLVGLAGPVVTGLGMGVAFPTLPLAAMRSAAAGEEAGELSSVLLMDVLGTATGSGRAGGIVAVAVARSTSLSTGLSMVFALGIATTVILVALAPRIDTDASRVAA